MLYAAYGSNLHPVRLEDRLPSARLVGKAFSPDWSLHFHKRSKDESAKCSISPGDDGVYFAVFDVSDKDMKALDVIEGVGVGYARATLDLDGFGKCESYFAQAAYVDDALQPYDWYKELVLAGARFHGFAEDYVARIARIQATCDPNPERRIEQWELVNRVRLSSALALSK